MVERLIDDALIFDNSWISVPQNGDRTESANLLASEFARDKIDFRDNILTSLENSGEIVASNKAIKGGEIFRLENTNGETIAVSVSKYYSWNVIKNQLCFRVHLSDGNKAQALSLERFGDLVKCDLGTCDYSIAVELAYNLVDARQRGKGLGSRMFALRIARAKNIRTDKPKLLFTMSRGAYLPEKSGKLIQSYMVGLESKANGEYPDGKAIISGIEVDIEDLRRHFNLPSEFAPGMVHPDSLPIVGLAHKAGMQKVGLFNDLSPIFAKSLD